MNAVMVYFCSYIFENTLVAVCLTGFNCIYVTYHLIDGACCLSWLTCHIAYIIMLAYVKLRLL